MLWINNLVLNKVIKIPSNENEYFIIEKHWEYSLKIIFNIEKVNLENLFVLLQSFLQNNSVQVLQMYTLAINIENENKIISHTNVFYIKKMNYLYFSVWWDDRKNYDQKYLNEDNEYGVLIVFSKASVDAYLKKNNILLQDFYDSIKPVFPWKEEILNYFLYFKA